MLDPVTHKDYDVPIFTPDATPTSTPRHDARPEANAAPLDDGGLLRRLKSSAAETVSYAVDAGGGLRAAAAGRVGGFANLAVDTGSGLRLAVAGRAEKTTETLGTLHEAARRLAASGSERFNDAAAQAAKRGSAALARVSGATTRTFESGARQTVVDVEEEAFAKMCDVDLLDVPRRTAHTQTFTLAAGTQLRWEFRVRALDLGFSLRRRQMSVGGAIEVDVVEPRRYGAGEGVAGEWTAPESCQVVARFDNDYSRLRAKTVLFRFYTVKELLVDSVKEPAVEDATEAAIAEAVPSSPLDSRDDADGTVDGPGDAALLASEAADLAVAAAAAASNFGGAHEAGHTSPVEEDASSAVRDDPLSYELPVLNLDDLHLDEASEGDDSDSDDDDFAIKTS
ncbi:hypothetical protein M885DRAFT_557286 [Pelagophyceae sp. CCMP2097]|nr:hypothetical protein M885DRAFT_557286 [Pelagophyceae sp. CCMP2097]